MWLLRTETFFILFVVFVDFVNCDNLDVLNENTDIEEDEDELKQALLLLNLFRAEYMNSSKPSGRRMMGANEHELSTTTKLNVTTATSTTVTSKKPTEHLGNHQEFNMKKSGRRMIVEEKILPVSKLTSATTEMAKSHQTDTEAKERTAIGENTKFNNDSVMVMDQVALQMVEELNRELNITRSNHDKINNQNNDKYTLEPLGKVMIPRRTIKIFLGRSSRLPIPLPQNNVFCHLEPKSPLCGAVI